MKRILFVCFLLLLLTGCRAGEQTPPAPEAPEAASQQETDRAPETEAPTPLGSFTAQTLTGDTLTESVFAERALTVVNVWGTFCGPCKEEMPVLGRLHQELEDVQVLGIVIDVTDQQGQPDESQVELALDLLEAAEADYPNLILNESLAMLGFAGVEGVPATLFVDQDGNLVGQGFYGALDEASWREVIAQRLEQAS